MSPGDPEQPAVFPIRPDTCCKIAGSERTPNTFVRGARPDNVALPDFFASPVAKNAATHLVPMDSFLWMS